uniref:UPF0506 domain-containing protein n=1 Tax=Trichobilharzia regenti TaxID=157069 RepID=A0AA85IVG5_TRIRE|nr:unnamed protein product [Trichobilharzia regenti]
MNWKYIILYCITIQVCIVLRSSDGNCQSANEMCSRFYKDKKPCCWPLKCQLKDEWTGICVRCIQADQLCVDNHECCSKRCVNYLCASGE